MAELLSPAGLGPLGLGAMADDPLPAAPQPRIAYLESLRGLASVQVLLLHVCSAYLPGIATYRDGPWSLADAIHASPLYFLYDGYAAISVFYLLSGYVLAGAFARQFERPLQALLARVARLGLPAMAALFLSAGLYWAFGGLNGQAGAITGSKFLAGGWAPEFSLAAILKESFDALFIGYSGVGPINGAPAWLALDQSQSYDVPLWSLSYEFYGSILVFALCWMRAKSPGAAKVAVLLLAASFSRGPYVLFVLGFALAWMGAGTRAPRLGAIASLGCVALGVTLCFTAERHQAPAIAAFCRLDTPWLAPCLSPIPLQRTFGAVALFIGVLQSGALRRALAAPILRYLGKISFPLYLVHWPLVFGVGPFALLALAPILGPAPAQALIGLAVVALALAGAAAFTRVDDLAMAAARRINGFSIRTAPAAA